MERMKQKYFIEKRQKKLGRKQYTLTLKIIKTRYRRNQK